jgi:uncharacterized protein DUF6457
VNEFFDKLAERLRAAASRRGATIAAPILEPVVADEVLELARVVAHTKERRFAPLASFVAGMAAERLRTSKAGSDAASVAAYIREVRDELEREAPPA